MFWKSISEKKKLRQRESTRQLMGISKIGQHSIRTPEGWLNVFLVKPDNLSVLSRKQSPPCGICCGRTWSISTASRLLPPPPANSPSSLQAAHRQRRTHWYSSPPWKSISGTAAFTSAWQRKRISNACWLCITSRMLPQKSLKTSTERR